MTTKLKKVIRERQYKESLYWGGAFFWAGLIFGAELLGILPQVGNADAWSWVFLGVGLYGLVINFYYLFSPNWSNPTDFDYLWSGFWLLVGLSELECRVLQLQAVDQDEVSITEQPRGTGRRLERVAVGALGHDPLDLHQIAIRPQTHRCRRESQESQDQRDQQQAQAG